MLFRILLIFLITLFQSNSYSDPFTNEIGITRQPEVVEVKPEETIEVEKELVAENDNNDQEINEEQPIEAEETIEVAEAEPQDTELVTILNIDPIVAYSLKDYLLKGVALSKESEHKFQRAKIRKFDRAKTPTTHTILENETVEQIAFRYGFSLREIELANAIYPGSRKLVMGDKIVIPSRFHIVKEGQNLTTIADRYNLNVTQLASYNDLDEESILFIGDKLLLPFFIHVTNMNETIADIAGRYEREIDELIQFNIFEENTVVLNENQLVKIPIYANQNISYENLDKKSINDFQIDRKNLAIIAISNSEFMVREGGRIGNRDGVIVSIEKNRMIVLEDNIEYEFLINTPIVGMAIASLPQSNTDELINDEVNNDDINNENQTDNNENNNESETVTNVEDLFN
ncbi:LysM peptidoglycan-binding domain-containing protein [Candidatus Pelagibacter sp. HIMB1321]|uniref:LysM peptidoglycan-binding domain-containing protein n=1 Tax=Candidatus Pelagibacter sp. HIMB1321 TaxID=1388755 RepID=UPI000A081030|nr:LysM peptidoglycan-binding domain-containing protein [Candidatus Pelagibacter sp. HIMB1321]SMF77602.1 LysM domain-containing protein [Candidatus Pelagibacter sp. HIMB1321]